MKKNIIMGVATLLIFVGCAGEFQPAPKPQPKPAPKPVEKVVETPKPVAQAPLKKGEVPPLPKREVDVDLDSAVDGASSEVMSGGSMG